ncbi:hypothetical protein SERLA73DRAFT_94297 [Serpula lacrymans var. lacrymans S7.3]|uniref:F-box domain-containing protein n=2 Tax=Serpula lacrymans var. lacrymans TaxID=341189 RepID=F8Q6I3_SERL3|nr:uncharacterized protein SERLADRAFT_440992 [Serpula lacrymans var. lacrymans S7.9]EGN96221.1 hypothetical protein SERLA73DRAFT_94297 [Serpula lacrymans var. lacrymans S7.3]EGO21758.1 hypothetical protein SERLADRAFT_440992 [Serpula lacrymans var. lacrymans S7.9]
MSSYVCDTLPAARLASANSEPDCPRSPSPPVAFRVSNAQDESKMIAASQQDVSEKSLAAPPQPPPRKLCIRHQRMADEGTNLKLQQSLDALSVQEREAVNSIWSNFSSSSHPRRELILQGLLTMCCFSQLSLLTEQLTQLIRIDPFVVLPREVSLKVLRNLDATSLCRAAQVNTHWRSLADDDILWRGICEQHIGQKCTKCGWGLPILERRRAVRIHSSPSCIPRPISPSSNKRQMSDSPCSIDRVPKRKRYDHDSRLHISLPHTSDLQLRSSVSASFPESLAIPMAHTASNSLLLPDPSHHVETITRPWKDVYSERLTIERNWRRGRCTVRTLNGHTDGVMCLQFNETLSHPSFPVLITGSYDRTIRVWNMESGVEIRCLRGHTRAVRALQFDEAKLITGSMDHTIRVWNWRRGECIRTLEGHSEGVVSLHFDSNVLASGSVDATIKVWNFRTGEAFTLRGHRDWVNSVRLWDSGSTQHDPLSSPMELTNASQAPHIDPGKMLFSASDDGTIRLWDLSLRTCVRQFTGHVGQVQSMRLLFADEGCDGDARNSQDPNSMLTHPRGETKDITYSPSQFNTSDVPSQCEEPLYYGNDELQDIVNSTEGLLLGKRSVPVLISGSLDNTIKLWDIETGKATRTLFGHIEGVWAIAGDNLRLVSGSHDRTIKVWNREEGRCTATLVGHRGAVTCLGLGEDKIVSGSDDGDIRIWSFSG